MTESRELAFRAVVTDLDGTLLDATGGLSAYTARILDRLVDAGVPVVPATARAPRSIAPVVPQASLAVGCNGTIVADLQAGRILWDRPFARGVVAPVVAEACRQVSDLGVGVRCGDRLLANEVYGRLRSGGLPDGAATLARPSELADVRAHSVAFRTEDQAASELADRLQPVVAGRGQISLSSSSVVDVLPVGASKVEALEVVANRQGWQPSQAVGFGDMPNDLELLAWVACGVAVANAHPEVLAAADEQAAGNHDEGVARFLTRAFGFSERG